ncbi:hypothetical protein NBRC116188_06070 [Oceaniserpentilla sp. 4NH20-0058]|uniref:hypothetical protein n=1 Tax=Oceaniserpentilla sp. 4NH20-0058 TaxID=3127660 RepID=UPI003102F263
MRNLILAVLLTIPSMAFSQADGESALVSMANEVAQSSCDKNIDYKKLFSLAVSGQYTGAANSEWLSEINEAAFFKCPEGFLRSLSSFPPMEQDEVLKYFGIVNPPWDIATALEPYEENHELSNFVNRKLGGFKSVPKP